MRKKEEMRKKKREKGEGNVPPLNPSGSAAE
jgi:hypothetical protein